MGAKSCFPPCCELGRQGWSRDVLDQEESEMPNLCNSLMLLSMSSLMLLSMSCSPFDGEQTFTIKRKIFYDPPGVMLQISEAQPYMSPKSNSRGKNICKQVQDVLW